MAGDVSNKTLAILVGVAVVVSVIGLFVGAPGGITGMQSNNETGYASANVVADVELTIVDNWIYLGELKNLESNSSDTAEANDNITINNSGASVVDVDYWGNESMWTHDCQGTDTANQSAETSTCYELRVMGNGGGTVPGGTYNTYQNVVLTQGNAVSILDDLPSAGVFTIGVNVTVPGYEPSGTQRNVSLQFLAVES